MKSGNKQRKRKKRGVDMRLPKRGMRGMVVEICAAVSATEKLSDE
jgi:hypothetical protein